MISSNEMVRSHAPYLRAVLQPRNLKILVEKAADVINNKFPDCDYIVGMGISGLAILSAVSMMTDKKMFILRKCEDTNNHSFIGLDINNHRENEYYPTDNKSKTAVIIDDLIATGSTVNEIYNRLFEKEILVEGIILYCDGDSGNEYTSPNNLEIPVYSVGSWTSWLI